MNLESALAQVRDPQGEQIETRAQYLGLGPLIHKMLGSVG